MKEICGHCNREFRGIYVPQMIWCKHDEMYVCWRCWEDVCGEGHGKKNPRKSHPIQSIVIASLVLFLFLPFAIPGLVDIYIRDGWEDLETTPLTDIQDGDLVRLEGEIAESENTIAIGGHESHSSKSGYNWHWNDKDTFRFSDGTGTVTVTTKGHYEIERGLHEAPGTKDEDSRVYRGGDEIIILGEVETASDGNATIHLLWAGSDAGDIAPSSYSYIVPGFLILLATTVYGGFLVLLYQRKKLHGEKIRHKRGIPIHPHDMETDPDLPWRFNTNSSKARLTRIATAVAAVGIILQLLLFLLLKPTSSEDYFDLAAVSIFFPPLFIFLPLVILLQMQVGPNSMAVSEQGVHFHYLDPELRFLRDNYIGWGEIERIGFFGAGKSRHWAIKKRNGSKEMLNGLKQQNRDCLSSAWEHYGPMMRPQGVYDQFLQQQGEQGYELGRQRGGGQ